MNFRVGFLVTVALCLSVLGCVSVRVQDGAAHVGSERDSTSRGERDARPPEPRTTEGPFEAQARSLVDSLPGSDIRVHPDTDPPMNEGRAYEQETSIAVNPLDPGNVVGLHQGGNVFHAWSFDGGRTWQHAEMQFPGHTVPFYDPAITVDDAGTFYVAMMSTGGPETFGVVVAKSYDGGATFVDLTYITHDGDKPWIGVDSRGDVHVVYTSDDFAVQYAKSTDGGATFSQPVAISGPNSGGTGAVPAFGPTGQVYAAWGITAIQGPTATIWFDRSLDGGDSWLATDVAAAVFTAPPWRLRGGFRNPDIPAMVVDRTGGPYHGRIYVVYQDAALGDPDVLVVHSDDDGLTWSAGVRANDDVPGNGADQIFSWMDIDENGHVHVTFLDRRDDPDGYFYGMYLATSTDGGASFGPNVRLSDGIFGPTDHGFLGDYTAVAVGGDSRLHALWPDGRDGDLDVYTRSVSVVDYDEDGVLNDGSGDGQYANDPCTGGAVAGCDDNCPSVPNPTQTDSDGDGVGDACDNCPNDANPDQFDRDRDAIGDSCDACPGGVGFALGDPDGDGVATCEDDCPGDPDPAQTDADGDGEGDACDCQTGDWRDRRPPPPSTLRMGRTNALDPVVSWPPLDGADAYSVTRGLLSDLPGGDYGSCFAEAIFDLAVVDDEDPPPGDGFCYLVQAQNMDCGIATLGYRRDGTERINANPGGCIGTTFSDRFAAAETTVVGIASGTLAAAAVSDDVYESITEKLAQQGGVIYGELDHRWTFNVPDARRRELHIEGFVGDTEAFVVSYSTNNGATWQGFVNDASIIRTNADDDSDISLEMVDTTAGVYLVRVTDGTGFPDSDPQASTFHVDQIFVRSID